MELRFDRFYRYDDLTAILKGFAARNSGLFAVESIGKSHEGRDIWVVTATRVESGPAADKPAFWTDGNIHAAELTASTACLYYLHTLEQGYGKDAEITRLLDSRASKPTLQAFLPNPDVTGDRGQCEWTVRSPGGGEVAVTARHDRAGRVTEKIALR